MDNPDRSMLQLVALAGGVGGAKLVDGLSRILPPDRLTVIVNVGDDFEPFGLRVCPDLDTVLYTLAGLANPDTGWGRAHETWRCMDALERLGGPTWFRLGDKDLATHLERTRQLKEGRPLSQVTQSMASAWGIRARVIPATDDPFETRVFTREDGELAFQDYFVRRRCEPQVLGFRFAGSETARPAPGVLEALETTDAVVFCPSNPWVSIGPILAIQGIKDAVARKTVVAVSPIVGGQALKGPAAKMYRELGFNPSSATVAAHYGALLSGLVIDQQDREEAAEISRSGIIPLVTQTIMRNDRDRTALARTVYKFCDTLIRR